MKPRLDPAAPSAARGGCFGSAPGNGAMRTARVEVEAGGLVCCGASEGLCP
jgi:hypothetical protein